MAFYAHTLSDRPPEQWQSLKEHLLNVSRLAGSFAADFGAEEWGQAAGLWHDLGKFSATFQSYLAAQRDYHEDEQEPGGSSEAYAAKTDHTSAGAQHAVSCVPVLGHLLAYPISGHHSGLLDAISDGACLEKRLRKNVDPWDHGLGLVPPIASLDELPVFLRSALARRAEAPRETAFTFAFFVRMLFSCLVDADYLDTEGFMDTVGHCERPRWPDDVLDLMAEAVDGHVGRLQHGDDPIATQRRKVREACLDAACMSPGLFSLTVPTGGGKTLSSLAFALRHAQAHGLKRIVYVIPFTSIIEQNADVFRRALAPLTQGGLPDPVIEHHSALDAGKEAAVSRLAAENWAAPLVVTTSVQFYESLFANRPRRCRKLHNLARSVIILDEAQKVPVDQLHPVLLALRELATNYGCSVVLCTATQPAVQRREDFPIGLDGVREIIRNPQGLHTALKRVQVRDLGSLDDAGLAERIIREPQVLCIVNTRRHARVLFESNRSVDGVVHLSAAMCPAHRTRVLDDVRHRLDRGEPCRAISTQLVEAGVDIDFPVVFRSLAGLDSIAQAAGRCNRNGRLASGVTFVFRSEHRSSERFLRDTAQVADQLLGGGSKAPLYDDLLAPEALEKYFHLYYWSQQDRWDAERIVDETALDNRRDLPFLFAFRSISDKFNLIEDSGQPVIIPWSGEGESEDGRELCSRLRAGGVLVRAHLLRRLQRYTVQIPLRTWQSNIGRNIELVHDLYPVLVSPDLHYDPALGLVLDREDYAPDSLIV